MSADLTGQRLGHYLVQSVLGRGGMSIVYRAIDERLDRPVALKVISENLSADEEFRERFVEEARAASAIDHVNVVPLYDFGSGPMLDAGGTQTGDWLYIAMRLVDGTDLAREVAGGPLPERRTLDLLGQVGEALDMLHERGLVHLDVKPANVLITRNESVGREHVYLADFGLTRRGTSGHRTASGDFLGSPTYASPEHLRGDPVLATSDLYSLTCVLFSCLAGRAPFIGTVKDVVSGHLRGQVPSLSALTGLPSTIDRVIARGMAADPALRYPSSAELLGSARRALTSFDAEPAGRSGPATTGHLPAGGWPAVVSGVDDDTAVVGGDDETAVVPADDDATAAAAAEDTATTGVTAEQTVGAAGPSDGVDPGPDDADTVVPPPDLEQTSTVGSADDRRPHDTQIQSADLVARAPAEHGGAQGDDFPRTSEGDTAGHQIDEQRLQGPGIGGRQPLLGRSINDEPPATVRPADRPLAPSGGGTGGPAGLAGPGGPNGPGGPGMPRMQSADQRADGPDGRHRADARRAAWPWAVAAAVLAIAIVVILIIALGGSDDTPTGPSNPASTSAGPTVPGSTSARESTQQESTQQESSQQESTRQDSGTAALSSEPSGQRSGAATGVLPTLVNPSQITDISGFSVPPVSP